MKGDDGRPAPARVTPPRERRRQRSALDAGFDRWLSRQLHEMYDPVLGEPLPAELAELLAGFDARTGGTAPDPAAPDPAAPGEKRPPPAAPGEKRR